MLELLVTLWIAARMIADATTLWQERRRAPTTGMALVVIELKEQP